MGSGDDVRPFTRRVTIRALTPGLWWQRGKWTTDVDHRLTFGNFRFCRTLRGAFMWAARCQGGAEVQLDVKTRRGWVAKVWRVTT